MVAKADKANVCVYFLRDPRDNQPRYVGITDNPRARWNLHKSSHSEKNSNRLFQHSKTGTEQRYKWFSELRELGILPVMDVIFTGLTERQARNVEAYILTKNRDRFYQAYSGRKDNLTEFTKIWQACSEREQLLIQRIIAQKIVGCES